MNKRRKKTSRFSATISRPTPYLKALEIDIICLLRREGSLNISEIRKKLGIVKGHTNPFDTVLKRAVKKGSVKREGDMLKIGDEEVMMFE